MSDDEFEDDYRREIYEEANALCDTGDWWNEPVCLYDEIGFPSHLTGSSMLIQVDAIENGENCYTTAVSPSENALMAFRDLVRIVEILRQLSAKHAIAWTLQDGQLFKDDPNPPHIFGRIVNGVVSDELASNISKTRAACGIPDDAIADTELHQRLLERLDAHRKQQQKDAWIEQPEYLPPEREV